MGFLIRIGIALATTAIGFAMIGELPQPFPLIVMGFGAFVVLWTIWEVVYGFLHDVYIRLRHKPKKNKKIIPMRNFMRMARSKGWDARPSHPQTPTLLRAVRAAADLGDLRIYGRRGDTPIRSTLGGHTVGLIPKEHWQEFQIDIRSITPRNHNSRMRTFSMNPEFGDAESYFDLHLHRSDAKRFLRRTKPVPVGEEWKPRKRQKPKPRFGSKQTVVLK